MKKLIQAILLTAVALPALPATTALAQDRYGNGYDRRDDRGYDNRDYRDGRGDRRYSRRDYDRNGRYREPRRLSRNDTVWRGRDGHYYCKRDNGTTGLIIGAGAGALLGNVVDGGRNRTLGTILGAVGGGLAGREIDRSDNDVRCR